MKKISNVYCNGLKKIRYTMPSTALGILRKRMWEGNKNGKRGHGHDMPFTRLHTTIVISNPEQLYSPALASLKISSSHNQSRKGRGSQGLTLYLSTVAVERF